MTSDEVDNYRRRAFAYGATRGQLGFDQQKLHDMVSSCAHRQELLRTDLKAGEMQILQGLWKRSASTSGVDPHKAMLGRWSSPRQVHAEETSRDRCGNERVLHRRMGGSENH
jgi:hypothetical protein